MLFHINECSLVLRQCHLAMRKRFGHYGKSILLWRILQNVSDWTLSARISDFFQLMHGCTR